MDERLKGIQEKFDFLEEIAGEKSLRDFLGHLRICAKKNFPFEQYYDDIVKTTLNGDNMILEEEGEGVSPITEDDMRYWYEYMKKEFEKSR